MNIIFGKILSTYNHGFGSVSLPKPVPGWLSGSSTSMDRLDDTMKSKKGFKIFKNIFFIKTFYKLPLFEVQSPGTGFWQQQKTRKRNPSPAYKTISGLRIRQ